MLCHAAPSVPPRHPTAGPGIHLRLPTEAFKAGPFPERLPPVEEEDVLDALFEVSNEQAKVGFGRMGGVVRTGRHSIAAQRRAILQRDEDEKLLPGGENRQGE